MTDDPMVTPIDVVVIGAGQAGLSAGYHLVQAGLRPGTDFIVLDADDGPGGAWQHRWPSLRFGGAHRVYPLPGMPIDDVDPTLPASQVVSQYYGHYEDVVGLAVVRPVRVRSVRRHGQRLLVRGESGVAGTATKETSRTWAARAVINATGTWTKPFWPFYPGRDTFTGRQLHTAGYQSAQDLADGHVVVVGGGASAVQLLDEISRVTTTTWVTRREPVWNEGPFDQDAGRAAVARVEARVREGLPAQSVVSVTGLALTPAVEAMRARGVLTRLPMFSRIVPDGVVWDAALVANGDRAGSGTTGPGSTFVAAHTILWCTGFRPALDHLAPLHLTERGGGIRVDGTRVAAEQRLHLVGYGPSASTVGANRAGRSAVREIMRMLAEVDHLGA